MEAAASSETPCHQAKLCQISEASNLHILLQGNLNHFTLTAGKFDFTWTTDEVKGRVKLCLSLEAFLYVVDGSDDKATLR
jgi:hypothetical protein